MEKKKTNELDKDLKLIAKSSIIVFAGLFLSKLFFYIYRLIVARFFGPEIYGLFSLALIILLWFVAFFSFGFDQGLLRFISYYRGKNQSDKIRYLISFSRSFLLFSSVLAGAILYFSSNLIAINIFHNEGLSIFLKTFSFLIPFYIFSSVFLSILRAHENILFYSVISNIVPNLLKVLTLVFLLIIGFKTNAVALSYFTGIFVMFLLSYFAVRKSISYIFNKSSINENEGSKIRKEFFIYSWPIMFFGIANMIFYWIDSFTIGVFLGATDVGLYNAVVPIAALLGFVPELFMQLFFPMITKKISKKDFAVVKELSQQIGKWIFILNIPLFFIMFLFPGEVIGILFGKEYVIAKNALVILSFGSFIATLSVSIPQNLLLSIGKSKLMLFNLLFLSLFNLILSIILIPKFGINGAAISTTLVNVLFGGVLLFQIYFYKSIIPIRRKVLKILIISLLPFLVVFKIKEFIIINYLSTVFLASFFVLFYFLLIFITGCLDKNDFMIINSIRKKYLKR